MIRHLPKNFDNVHNLEFRKDEYGNPTKIAIGMYSGESINRLELSCRDDNYFHVYIKRGIHIDLLNFIM